MANKFTSFLDKYSNNPRKAATLGIILLVIVLVIWIVFKIFGKKIQDLITSARNQLNQSASMNDIENRYPGQQKTYTSFEYNTFADKLYTAMKGPGTNESAIQQVMQQMKNDLDVYALIDAFGTRAAAWPSSWSGTLSAWLTDELSTSEMEKYVNQPLRSRGISYQF